MTSSTDFSDLLDLIPVDQIAAQLGVDTTTAQAGIAAALPALLGGLEANAQDPAGAASLVSALQSKDTSLVTGVVDVADIDTADGEKIVRNVFGDNTDQVIATLGNAQGPQSSGLLKQLLPILAPIVLSWLANKFLGGGAGGGQAAAPQQSSGGGLGDLLGGILGGAAGGGGSQGAQQGGGLGDLLGGILGGAAGGGQGGQAPQGGGLGDLLGGILGGGQGGGQQAGGGLGDLLGGLLGGGKR